jgi:hypothetical protein
MRRNPIMKRQADETNIRIGSKRIKILLINKAMSLFYFLATGDQTQGLAHTIKHSTTEIQPQPQVMNLE